MGNLQNDVNAAKTDVSKVVSTVKADVAAVEAKTYSGKVLLVVAAVALVVGFVVRCLL